MSARRGVVENILNPSGTIIKNLEKTEKKAIETDKALQNIAERGLQMMGKSADNYGEKIDRIAKRTEHLHTSAQKTFSTSIKSANGFSKSLGNIEKGVKAISFKAMVNNFRKFFSYANGFSQSAVDYIEDLNLLKVAFGDTADEAFRLVENIAGVTGFDQATLTRNLGTFRNLTSTLGTANEIADLLAMNLEKMSLDISSLYNVNLDRSAYALTGMLTGQPRTIKTLTGANITQNALQEDLAALGINRTVRELNKAEKAILSYISLEKQLMQSNGDLARTIEQPAQLLRVFREQIQKAARSIGSLLIPAIQAVVPYLTAILMVFNELVSSLMVFLGVDAESFWNDMTAGTKDLASGLGSVSKAADNAKRGLRNFDKLNVITSPTKGGSGGGSGSGLGNLGIDNRLVEALKEYNLHLDKIKTKAIKIKEEILNWLGFTKQLNGEWKWSATKLLKNIYNWWKKLNVLGKTLVNLGIVAALSGIWALIKKLAGTEIAAGISILAESIGRKGLVGTLSELGKVYPVLSKVIGAAVGIAATADGFFKLKDAITSINESGANIENITKLLSGLLEIISGIAIVVGAFTQNWALVVAGIAGIGGALLVDLIPNAEKGKEKIEDLYGAVWQLNENQKQTINDMQASADRAQEVVKDIERLYDANDKLSGSYEYASGKIEVLNDLLGTEYKLNEDGTISIGKKKIKISELSKAVDDYCNKLIKEAKFEAYREMYVENVKKQYDAKKKYNELLAEVLDSEKNYNTTTKDGIIEWLGDNKQKLDRLNEMDDVIKKNADELSNYENAFAEMSKGNYTTAIDMLENFVSTAGATYDQTVNDVLKSTGKISDEVLASLRELDGKSAKIEVVIDTAKAEKKLKEFKQNATYQIQFKTLTPTFKADGGFVNSGEVYVARENGMSEYIGQMGRKTAVANNDQIVEGISKGVRDALVSAGGLNNRPVVIKADSDTNGLMNFIRFKQQEDEMQYGN